VGVIRLYTEFKSLEFVNFKLEFTEAFVGKGYNLHGIRRLA
jgi:hypothetical protein